MKRNIEKRRRGHIIRDVYTGKIINDREAISIENIPLVIEKEGLLEERERRNNKIFLTILTILTLLFTIQGSIAADYRTGLIHEWNFSEQTGTNANDNIGTKDLTLTSATLWEDWWFDGTGVHTGTSGYVTRDDTWLTGNAWTVILVYQANQTLNKDIIRLRPTSGTPLDTSEIRISSDSSDPRKYVYTAVHQNGNAAGYKQFIGSNNYVNNTKITLGIVWDGTALWGYYNGTKESLTSNNNNSITMNSSYRKLGFGGWASGVDMVGSHLRIYNQSLTAAQMLDVTNYLFSLTPIIPNEPPVFTSLPNVTTDYNVFTDEVINTIVATDEDNDTLTYGIIEDSTGKLDINSSSGSIYLTSNFNVLDIGYHNVTVNVTDGTDTDTGIFFINITDVTSSDSSGLEDNEEIRFLLILIAMIICGLMFYYGVKTKTKALSITGSFLFFMIGLLIFRSYNIDSLIPVIIMLTGLIGLFIE